MRITTVVELSNDCHDRCRKEFFTEEEILRRLLEDNFVVAHHIGSTSIDGLLCKPRVDIALELHNFGNIMLLTNAGYVHYGELNIPFRHFFSKRNGETRINLHVLERGNPEVEGFLLFRNYLKNNKEALDEYAKLKREISMSEAAPKDGKLLGAYTLAKDSFIRKILERAGFKGPCLRYVTHHNEKDYAAKYRTDNPPLEIVFYEGPRIIGYSCLDESFAISVFEIEEPQYKEYFYAKIERLIQEKINA
jgi:GrpB-like predicted nucleotidyltransferase (UPF0157 family)